MRFETVRRDVADASRGMVERRLSPGTSGNVSARAGGGLIAITPTGVDHARLAAADIVLVDAKGAVIEGDLAPSSEVPMHLAVYAARPDVQAVVHTHSEQATTLAVLGEDLPPVHYTLAFAGRRVRCAPYERYGTPALAAAALEALGEANAVLLGNHGVLAVGASTAAALNVAEVVEVVAGYYLRARVVGMPRVLDDEEMTRVMEAFKTYGQPPRADS